VKESSNFLEVLNFEEVQISRKFKLPGSLSPRKFKLPGSSNFQEVLNFQEVRTFKKLKLPGTQKLNRPRWKLK
jgi:hypothetical protein